MTDFKTITVERSGQAATLRIGSRDSRPSLLVQNEIGSALAELRFDNDVRVIVLTGSKDGFFLPPAQSPAPRGHHSPGVDWDVTQGMHHTYEMFLETEKPIVAKVNGNAVGFGSSLIFACDFIVACEDAIFVDHHMGMGETVHGGPSEFGCVPGDGGTAFVPMHMTPCLAKEYLWLAREMTGAELARAGIINAAVPAAELDAKVERMVQSLLKRTPHSLALAKRAINQVYIDMFNRRHDLSWSYEVLNFYMHGQAGKDGRGTTRL